MSTFMLKSKPLNFTPVSNIFIEKYMPLARGEFIKVYLLMLKHNVSGEPGVSSSVLASSLTLLESDILNALNYWSDEGVIKLNKIDKFGNFEIEFLELTENMVSNTKNVNIVEALTSNEIKGMLNDISSLLGRTLSPTEINKIVSWNQDCKFPSELILILFEYCISQGKTDFRYIDRVAINWFNEGIDTIEKAQMAITKTEDKWTKFRHILNYLGIKNGEVMKPQEEMLDKWVNTFNFPLEVIEKACNICFQRLNRADFKYIDGILSSWNKDNLKTVNAIAEKEANYKAKSATAPVGNYTGNNSKRLKKVGYNSVAESNNRDYDPLEKELLGWYNND